MQAKTISISGVDGSGKSTLIDAISEHLTAQGYNVKVIRSRPLGFPILSSLKHGRKKAEAVAARTRHSNKIIHNQITSLFKFTYYYLDYLLGSLWLHYSRRYTRNIIIFDRYYFDYICDQSRFSLNVNILIVNFLAKFIHIPDINVYLQASKEKIYQNRDEQTPTQILDASRMYENLFSVGSETYGMLFFIVDGLSSETTSKVIKILNEN